MLDCSEVDEQGELAMSAVRASDHPKTSTR